MAYYEDQRSKINMLCYDILEQILPFLSVKSLLRFKAVCKSTRDLISSPTFVKCHATDLNRVVSQIHLSEYPYQAADEPGQDPWYVSISSINSEPSGILSVEFSNPFNAPIQYVLGSCNGVLLVAIANQSFLWNPTIREYVELSKDNIWNIDDHIDNYDNGTNVLVGLGYDSVVDDYKVVLYIDSDHMGQNKLLVYSFRTGRKKVAQDFDCKLSHSKRGVTMNGCPHWIIRKYNDPFTYNRRTFDRVVLIYFDIMEEKLKSLSTPIEWFCNYPEFEPYLGTLSGRICATLRSYAKSTSDVWVMNEFGVGDSWTKLFVISHSLIRETFRPIGFIDNGDEVVLVLNIGKIVTYNHRTEKRKVIRGTATNYWPNEFHLVEYTESLVSPRTFAKISRQRKRRSGVRPII